MSSGPKSARPYYERARWFDSGNLVALDRLLFLEILNGTHRRSVRLLSDAALQHSRDNDVILDRALLERKAGRIWESIRDFKRLATTLGNSRYMLFAALLERGRLPKAEVRADLRAAIRLDPKNILAHRALQRL